MSVEQTDTTNLPAASARKPVVRRESWLRTHALEILLLGVTVLLLLFTMVATARVALNGGSPVEDLTFEGTLRELSLVLTNGGPDQLARLDRAALHAGDRVLVVDTIALLADPDDEPAAARGGFISDHAVLYNDHAIRRALNAAMLGDAAPRGDADGPSILRSVRTESGERRLSDRPSPFALTVRSPYAERTWREVRTEDWTRSGGLLGLQGDVALGSDVSDGTRVRLNGRDCTIRRDDSRLLLYCRSALASDVSRFYDLGFELSPAQTALGPTHAFSYRPGDIWSNGASRSFTRGEVHAGDVFDVEWIGPFALSVSERGTLAAGQWINGRHTFTNQRLGTISFFGAAGRAPGGSTQAEPLVLSLDAALSLDLEAESRRFMTAHGAPLLRMSVVIMDVRTGELKAIAEPARRRDDESLMAFEPLLVGSVVKPIVAAAILARQPELGATRMNYAGDTVRVVANVPLERGFANAANGCFAGIAFIDFIRCSSNQYAAELLVRSLRTDGFNADAGGSTVVPRDVLEGSALGAGLAEAFDVDAFGFRTAGRNPALWTAAVQPQGSGEVGTTNRALLPWESRPWILFPETDGTRLDLLARYAFGGWENRWTLLGIAEAYARIATGREVRAGIFARPPQAADAAPVPPNVGASFRRVRGALQQVGVDGTAAGLSSDMRTALRPDLAVLSKTGTLNEDTDRFKSLALAVGVPEAGTAGELSCGLVAVTYFEFASAAGSRQSATPLPPVHLEFARNAFADVLRRHWERVSGCAPPSSPGEP